MLGKIRKFFFYSLLFVVASFVRYFPTKWLERATDVSRPLGHDARLYVQGASALNNIQGVGWGHSLTLFVSDVVKFFAPDSIQGIVLLGFFSLVFVWTAYVFIRPELEREWVVFVLVPFALVIHRITTNGNYAQTLSISLFMLSFVFWRGGSEFLSGLSLVAMFSSHVWSGSLLLLAFGIYFVIQSELELEYYKEKWRFFAPFLPLLLILALRQSYLVRWIKFFLVFHQEGTTLFHSIVNNPTNMENIGILGFFGVGLFFLYYKKDALSKTWKFTAVWTFTILFLVVIFWGGQTFRIWSMIPFIFPAIYGLDKLLEKGYILPSVIFIMVCVTSGWMGI